MTVRFRPLVAAAMLLVAAQSAYAQTPTPTDIGNLGGGSASVIAVADGYVGGSSSTGATFTAPWGPYPVTHAFVWSASTQTMVDVGALISGGALSAVTSVNSRGEAVGGWYPEDFSSTNGFYWSQATGLISLGPIYPNYYQTTLLISENGVVAGVSADGQLFRWTPSGGFTYLGYPPASYYPYLSGINSRGDIIGGASDLSSAFVAFASSNTLTTLTSPGLSSPPPIATQNEGGVNIQLNGINDNGVVVGTYWDYRYMYSGYDISQGGFFNAVVHNSHAFKWSSSGGFADLGNLGTWPLIGPPYPTYSNFAAFANAINNSGEIVGTSYLPTGGYAPFLYNPTTHSLTQLPALYPGDNGAQATGINDDGVIVGYANGTAAAVMWINGVLTQLVPSPTLPLQWPGAPFIKGSTIAGNGLDRNWNGHAWVLSLPSSDRTPPVIVPQVSGSLGNNGWYVSNVTVAWSVTDAESVISSTSGCTTSTVTSDTAGTTFTCTATSAGGTASSSVTIKRDATAPAVSCSVTPSVIWPPNHTMVNVNASVSVSDAASGAAGFTLVSAVSNEPDNGLGDGDKPNDIQGFVVGGADIAGQVRAERSGKGNGRVYTLTYTGVDQAGNGAACSATVSVPHNR